MGHEGRDGKDRDEDDQVDVWCFIERKTEMRMIRWMCDVSLKERRSSSEVRRCVGVEAMWGCNEKTQTEVARTCGKKGRCRLHEGMYYVDGEGEGTRRQVKEDLANPATSETPP